MPKESKGGAIAPSDIPIIRKALHAYLVQVVLDEEENNIANPELNQIANLLHRLGRIGRD